MYTASQLSTSAIRARCSIAWGSLNSRCSGRFRLCRRTHALPGLRCLPRSLVGSRNTGIWTPATGWLGRIVCAGRGIAFPAAPALGTPGFSQACSMDSRFAGDRTGATSYQSTTPGSNRFRDLSRAVAGKRRAGNSHAQRRLLGWREVRGTMWEAAFTAACCDRARPRAWRGCPCSVDMWLNRGVGDMLATAKHGQQPKKESRRALVCLCCGERRVKHLNAVLPVILKKRLLQLGASER